MGGNINTNINELAALLQQLPERELNLVLTFARGLASRASRETHSQG